MNNDLEQAISRLRSNADKYARPERYYNGDHDLAFATEKFQNAFGTLFREFALNLCPVICDAVRDKLRVTGFSVDSIGKVISMPERRHDALQVADTDSLQSAVNTIWLRNRMGIRAGEVHKEALKCGDAYILVWLDENGEAALYPHKASSVTVVYDDDDIAGRIRWAAKAWNTSDRHIRLNIFYPDRVEKYITRSEAEGSLPDAKAFVQFGGTTGSTVTNPYGIVPVFRFANNADLGANGRSELDAAIPIQDGLNKSVLDMLVAMEFAAYRQRWAAGIEIEIDANGNAVAPFKAGVEHLWITENPNATFGDFEAARLDQFLKVKDSFRLDIASVTGTPLHYLLQNISGPRSGESLKRSETRFLAKVRSRQESFGQAWADAISFALMVEGRSRNVRLQTLWEDPSPMSEREVLDNILMKRQIGLPIERALAEIGYGKADIKTMIGDGS